MTASDDILAIRRSLGFEEAHEEAVREAGKRLTPEVDGWVDRFYLRLLTDPEAMRVIGDEASVIRLKRSLTAWFLEMFSLPVDEAYLRAREEIGRVHVRRAMPQYLMVTAMGALKRDVAESVWRLFGAEPGEAARIARALDMLLDLELALMLGAYRRRTSELTGQIDRALQAMRLAQRYSLATRDAVDAALCYAEILRRAPPEERDRWSARLEHALHALVRLGERVAAAVPGTEDAPRKVRVAALLAQALTDARSPALSAPDVAVEPPDLEAVLRPVHCRLGLEELIQNAEHHAPGSTIRLAARPRDEGGVVLEVTDTGPGWPAGARTIEDLDRPESGGGLGYCASAARLHGGSVELFEAPGGGAGVRIHLPSPPESGETTSDAPLAQGTRRRAP